MVRGWNHLKSHQYMCELLVHGLRQGGVEGALRLGLQGDCCLMASPFDSPASQQGGLMIVRVLT